MAGRAKHNYMREISSLSPLPVPDLAALVKKMLRGSKEARESIVLSQLSLVVQIAHEFTNRGLEVEELIAEGNCGLMQAVDNYDLEKGEFETHIRNGVKSSITLALELQAQREKERQALADKLNSIIKAIQTLTQKLDRIPTEEELAEHLEISREELQYLMKLVGFWEEEKTKTQED